MSTEQPHENNRRIDDKEVLELIQNLVMFYRDGKVYKWHGGHRRYVVLQSEWTDRNGRGRFNLHIKKRQRTIQANRLIWMLVNKRIPDGDVDHIDQNNGNNHPDNLRDRCPVENRRDNTLKGYNECVDYFNRKLAAQYGSKGDF